MRGGAVEGALVGGCPGALALSEGTLEAAERARALVDAGTNGNTARAYAAAWEQWEAFCSAQGCPALSREQGSKLLLVWIGALRAEGLKVSTVKARIAAVVAGYRAAGLPSPADDDLVRRARRGLGVEAASTGERRKQAKPLTVDRLRAVVGAIPGDVRGLRDRAIVLLGFAAALRRSEIAGLAIRDVELREGGAVVFLARSKTDQAAAGRRIPVREAVGACCPVGALRAWLEVLSRAGVTEGPLFRSVGKSGRIGRSLSDWSVWSVFVDRGLDAGVDGLSGHSGRVGFVWSASLSGASAQEIASVTGHKALSTVLGYVGEAHLLRGADPLRGALGGSL